MSKREALALTRLASQNRTIITISDIQDVIDVPYDDAKKIANNLVHKKWLDRLKSGTCLTVTLAVGETGEYTEHEFVIASSLADPMYISYVHGPSGESVMDVGLCPVQYSGRGVSPGLSLVLGSGI